MKFEELTTKLLGFSGIGFFIIALFTILTEGPTEDFYFSVIIGILAFIWSEIHSEK